VIEDLIKKNRSYRRFHEDKPISRETLIELVNLARLSPSAANLQPLKFILSSDPEKNAKIFPTTAWAGYLKDWKGPAEGERPAAYIIIVGDTEIRKGFGCDHGIAAQSILLGAAEKGIGGCMIGSIAAEDLRKALDIPTRYEILLILALGYPNENVTIEDVKDGDIHYYHDAQDGHHVPKRTLKELILEL
jgi:nitroreductase